MAGPPVRERYNSKARRSVAGGGSHKKRKRPTAMEITRQFEGDADGILPSTKRVDGEEDGSEVAGGDGRGHMSAKKRKRMDSYIAKKLKSESRLETMKLLASLAPATNTSTGLLSSSSLGQKPYNPTSARERAEIREDRLVRRGIETLAGRRGANGDDDDGESEDSTEEIEARRRAKGKGKAAEEVVEADEKPAPNSVRIQPHSDGAAARKAKTRKSKQASWNPNLLSTQPESSGSDFDSSEMSSDESDMVEDRLPPGAAPPLISEPPAVIAVAEPSRANGSGEARQNGSGSATDQAHAQAAAKPRLLGAALRVGSDGKRTAPIIRPKRVVGVFSQIVRQSEDDQDEEEDQSSSELDGDESDGDEDDEASSGIEQEVDGDPDDGEIDDSSEEAGSDDSDSDGEVAKGTRGRLAPTGRSAGFKAWAIKQLGRTTGLHSTNEGVEADVKPDIGQSIEVKVQPSVLPPPPGPKGPAIGPLGATLAVPSTSSSFLAQASSSSSSSSKRPRLSRRPSVSEARMELPILAEEQSIVEAIQLNPIVVICGETGSGKTTQVPQMLYEAGFGYPGSDNPGMIAVTQPRRVAAVSLAARVKSELKFPQLSGIVAHQIRYSSTTSPDTAIKFMTDGVLLRELSADFLLSKYSVVVVDEAHERGVNTDVLIGVLSRVAKLREKKWRESGTDKGSMTAKPLRIIIMSATLRLSDFTQNTTLFPTPPPTIHIPARQHPVTIHFSRKTVGDYVTEAYKKVCKIHARLPPGGVLVFMTGQAEIMGLCRKLEMKYARRGNAGKGSASKENLRTPVAELARLPAEDREAEEVEFGQDNDLAADVDDGDVEDVADPDALDTDEEDDMLDEASDAPLHVLPLYSLLSNEQQLRVFQPPPDGHRLVIIATNVAETSLTIPGIRYVIDTGRAKERAYDTNTGVQSFQVQWISKASANQRAGRAGRTGPGHCYRLYSSALFEDHFAAFSEPEILRMPIEGVVLQMKSMGIDQVVNFPFPTPPDRLALRKAESLLQTLGALSSPTHTIMASGQQRTGEEGGRITPLGITMAGYPVAPRFGKMLAIGDQHGCLGMIVAIVAGMSVGDPFVHESAIEAEEEDGEELEHLTGEEERRREERKEARKRYFKAQSSFLALGDAASDIFKLLAAIGAYEFEPTTAFCSKNFLRVKAMQEIQQLRGQISTIIGLKTGQAKLKPPTDVQLKVLRQIITSAFIDQIAVRSDVFDKKPQTFSSCRNVPYRISTTSTTREYTFVHPSSAVFHRPPPEYLVYTEIHRTSKAWMKGVTTVNPGWIWSLGRNLCSLTRPTELVAAEVGGGVKKKAAFEGRISGNERTVGAVPHLRSLGVDLPAVKVKQRREGNKWVYVD